MSDEQNRETGGSPPPPTGGAPPPAPGTPAPGPWLPPRLRDRLYGAEDEPAPKADNPIMGWLAMLVIAAMIGGLVYWRMQKSAAEKKVVAEKARVERAAAVADSLDRIRIADSLRTVARADSIKSFLALPVWKRKQILAGGDTSKAAAPVAETGHYVIDAGRFLFEEPAQAAMAKIKAGTRLAVRVVPIEQDGATAYHVYVGDFRERAEATYLANQLFEKGTLAQANVVKLDQ